MKLGIPVEGKMYFVILNVRTGVSRYVVDGEHITLTEYGVVVGERQIENYSDHTGKWESTIKGEMVFHPWHMVERIEEMSNE
ncbi:hypothetical protein [Streptomyces sp. NPDC023838]|uniref:hypothetical protein n=1 Tax=Streptomyces sp. NPDC023838 TaxID=3154325 RepID=UPI0033FBA1D0